MKTVLMVMGQIVVSLTLLVVAWYFAGWLMRAIKLRENRTLNRGIRIFTVATIAALLLHPLMPLGQLVNAIANSTDHRFADTYQTGVQLGDKTVAIGGGGAVTGVYLHPRQKDLVYIRTDVGGFYRWQPENQTWLALTDQFPRSQRNYYGGEALALDPQNPDVVYIAVGKTHWHGPGTLLKSSDRGATWKELKLVLPLPKKEYRRWVGDRLAVNPFNSQELLFGSWKSGLWRSADAGTTWSLVKSFPSREKSNISVILFDPKISGRVFAFVDGEGVYQSADAGANWQQLKDSPKELLRMAIASDGTLYATGDEKSIVVKYANNTWQDISPPNAKPAFNAITINPANPQDILVSRGEKVNPGIYRSRDGGKQWRELSRNTKNTVPWWPEFMQKLAWVAAMEFDPHSPGRVWLVDWYGIWRTDDINANPATWTNYQQGHEEVVVLALAAPPKGTLLLSGMADMDGFVHNKGLDAFPDQGFGETGPRFQDTYSIAYCEADPSRIVRVGGNRSQGGVIPGTTSQDGGMTWKAFKSFPEKVMPTRVAVSATDPNLFVVTTSKGQPIRTTDGGNTWKPVSGLPDGMKGPWHLAPQSLVADKVDGQTFYYYSDRKVYRSTDGAASFQVVRDDLPGENWHLIQTLPGVKGEVWLGLEDKGLFRSVDGGKTFSPISSVKEAFLFDFGKPPAGSNTPALYLYGKPVGKEEGLWRSLDLGKTWTGIGNPKRPIGNEPNTMAASRQKFGLVFVGTGGRGIYYGAP